METVVIKLYRNDIGCSDYRDLCLDSYAKLLEEIRRFFDKIGNRMPLLCRIMEL